MAIDTRRIGPFFVNIGFDPCSFEYLATVSNGRYLVTLHAPTQPKLKDRVDRLIRGYFGETSADIVFSGSAISQVGSAWAA